MTHIPMNNMSGTVNCDLQTIRKPSVWLIKHGVSPTEVEGDMLDLVQIAPV